MGGDADLGLREIEALYRRHGPAVLYRCKGLLAGDEDGAWDAMHQTFVRAIRYRSSYRGETEALFRDSPFAAFLELPDARPLGFDPAILVTLSEDCRLQARISFESRTGAYQVRTGKYKEDEQLSLYLSIRQYPDPGSKFSALDSYNVQRNLCEELMGDKVIPGFVNPILGAIGQRR